MKKFFLLLFIFTFSSALSGLAVAADKAVMHRLNDKEIAQVEEIAMLAKQQNLSDEHVAAMVKDALHEEADELPFSCHSCLLPDQVFVGAIIAIFWVSLGLALALSCCCKHVLDADQDSSGTLDHEDAD